MPFPELSSAIAAGGRLKTENGKEITNSLGTKLSEIRKRRKIKYRTNIVLV